MSTNNAIREIFLNSLGFDTSGYADTDALFSAGVLDSLSSVQLLLALESSFNISVSPLDISLEDVDSIEKIAATVESLKQ